VVEPACGTSFAAASLTLGVCSFISALGVEKSILAIVFGVLALRNTTPRPGTRLGLARFGILLGILPLALLVVLLAIFRQEAMRFLEYLNRFQVQR
jgi:hypothetical protein